jgi:YaiO family outer membrane protein
MRRISCIIISVTLISCGASAEEVKKEREIKEVEPRLAVTEKKLYFDSYYEYGWVKQGSRKGAWKTLSSRLAYLHNNLQTPYLEITRYDRLKATDYTVDLGSYFKLQDAYAQAEIGFGDEIDYVYRFQTTLECSHKLIKNLFWKLGARYLNYAANDVLISSPGLIYYFGGHYLSLDYGNSITESRGMAHWGDIKGNFAITKRLQIWMGTALGERLYDIYAIKASKQYGYIFFTGFNFKTSDNMDFRVGYSYSMEKPSFIKRDLNCAFYLKF